MSIRLSVCIAAIGFVVSGKPANAAISNEKPAASMHDLRDYFAGCFHPPREAADTRVTFYFSLNNRGGVIGRPRTTWLGFKGPAQEKLEHLTAFEGSFDKCLPLPLNRTMASTIPGKVFFLQYIVGADGKQEQILFRPFGSHGGFSAPAPLGIEPLEPAIRTGPIYRPAVTFGPRPQVQRRAFRQPPFIPFRRFFPGARMIRRR